MGYKPFIVGFVGMATVGLVSIASLGNFLVMPSAKSLAILKYFFFKLEKNLLINAAPTPKIIANIIENSP